MEGMRSLMMWIALGSGVMLLGACIFCIAAGSAHGHGFRGRYERRMTGAFICALIGGVGMGTSVSASWRYGHEAGTYAGQGYPRSVWKMRTGTRYRVVFKEDLSDGSKYMLIVPRMQLGLPTYYEFNDGQTAPTSECFIALNENGTRSYEPMPCDPPDPPAEIPAPSSPSP